MGLFSWIIVGFIAGAIAKAIVPGNKEMGWLKTLALGVGGAFVGGILGSFFLDIGLGSMWDLRTWGLAIAGSVLVLFLYGLITKNKQKA